MIFTDKINKLPGKVMLVYITQLIFYLFLMSIPLGLLFQSVTKAFTFLIIIYGVPRLIYVVLKIDSVSFTVGENEILKTSGITIKKSKSVPFTSIQNIQNVTGLFLKLFNISEFQIWTSSQSQIQINRGASQNTPDFSLYLESPDAEWLKNYIINKVNLIQITPNSPAS